MLSKECNYPLHLGITEAGGLLLEVLNHLLEWDIY